MSTPLKLRATQALCTSQGGLLATTDPYDAPVDARGELHPEDQAHLDAGRLVPQDDRKVGKDGALIGKAPETPPAPKPEPAAKQEA